MRTVHISGGNLFFWAAKYLRDPTRWDEVARLNNIRDPMLIGVHELLLPDFDDTDGARRDGP